MTGDGADKIAAVHEDPRAAERRPRTPKPRVPAKPERFSGRSARFGAVPFGLKSHVSPHGQITAVSMMKDEGPFVIEWVAHQIALGFTDLVVYTNDCSDGTDLMLMRLEELGLAHHRVNVIPPGLRPQPSALSHAQAEPVVQASDWVMVFDADEFLSIRYGDGTLDDLIGAAKARGANGIVVTWRIFGSGGVVEWSRDPVTEQYLMAAPADWNKGWGVKTLFQYDAGYWNLGIHRPKMKNKWIDTGFPEQVRWLNGSGRPMEEYFKFRGWRSIVRTIGYDWVQLNHYAVKSIDSYAIRKLRGNVNFKKDKYNSDYWALQDRNEVRDETQLRYRERRGAVIAALLSDPVLRELHEAAVERAEARLAEIKAGEDYTRLKADLAAASARPLSEIVAKPPQARDPAKIAAKMSEVEKRRTGAEKAARREAGEKPPVSLPEADYLALPLDAAAEPACDWHENHGIVLPADGRVFAPAALKAIAEGKFQRGLARKLPGMIPEAARVLALGAGCGFLAAHLARARPDISVSAFEAVLPLATTLRRVLLHNGLEARVAVAADWPDGSGPRAMLLGDPAATPDLLAGAAPDWLLVHGRLAAASDAMDFARWEEAAVTVGLVPAELDPRLGRLFARN